MLVRASLSSIGRLWAGLASEASELVRVHESEIFAKRCRDPPGASARRPGKPPSVPADIGPPMTTTPSWSELSGGTGSPAKVRRTSVPTPDRASASWIAQAGSGATWLDHEAVRHAPETVGGGATPACRPCCVNIAETGCWRPGTGAQLMFDRILLALDDSPAGEVATVFSAALARRTGATVHVLHVNERLVGGNGLTLRSRHDAAELVTNAVQQLADAGVRAAGSVRVAAYRGIPMRIVEAAHDRKADAIVLGSNRRPASGAALLGPGPRTDDAPHRAARSDGTLSVEGVHARWRLGMAGRAGPNPRFAPELGVLRSRRRHSTGVRAEEGTFCPIGGTPPTARIDGWSCTSTS